MSAVLTTDDERLATLSLDRLTDDELERVHLQLFFEREVAPSELSRSVAHDALSMLASRFARARREAQDPIAEVRAARALIRLRQWVANRYERMARGQSRDLPWLVDSYRGMVGRGIHPSELSQWMVRMRVAPLDRDEATAALRRMAEEERRVLETPREHAGHLSGVLLVQPDERDGAA